MVYLLALLSYLAGSECVSVRPIYNYQYGSRSSRFVEQQKCQNVVCDLDLENEVKVQRSQNFEWPYHRYFYCIVEMFVVLRTFNVCE